MRVGDRAAGDLAGVAGIKAALAFGSWAARHTGQGGVRPVGDIDVLVLGDPDRDALYEAASRVERQLGRPGAGHGLRGVVAGVGIRLLP